MSSEQPRPVPNDSPSVQSMVRDDLTERERIGVARYGTPLQPHNGRDALRDSYEEAMDLTTYLRQVIAERDNRSPFTLPAPRLAEGKRLLREIADDIEGPFEHNAGVLRAIADDLRIAEGTTP